MSTNSRGSGGGNGIPAGSRKMVQSLKEIVNCPEAEIYATLKDCNMDPNEAVNRLLSQDPFHEVKSKREKKKQVKDTTESRPRGANNSSKRGGKSGSDRYLGRGGSTPYYSSESTTLHGRPTYKKKNESNPYTSSLSSAPGILGTNKSRGLPNLSDGFSAENKVSQWDTSDGILSGAQPPAAYQSAWAGVPGQMSMADIVKMVRPHNKAVNAPNASHNNVQYPSTTTSHHNSRFPNDHDSNFHESGVSQQVPIIDEWPSMEKPAASTVNSIPEYTLDSEVHPEASSGPFDSVNQDSDSEEDQGTEDGNTENYDTNDVGSVSIPSSKVSDNDSRGASVYENDLYKNMGSHQPQAHEFDRHEAEEVGSSVAPVTRNLQQLSVNKDTRGLSSDGDAPSVVIPDHLQVQTADCSHLSFGSFGSAMSVTYSAATMTSIPVKTNLEEQEADISSIAHPDTRNSEYYVDDSLRNASDGSLFRRNIANIGSYDASSASQPEELKPETAEVAHGNQYPFPSSNPGYSFEDAQRLNAAFSHTSADMQNLSALSNAMHSYPNSMPNTLLAANVYPNRESELQYSPFPVTQSMSAKFGDSVPSVGGSAISMSEALKTAGFSNSQTAPQNLSGTSVATGPPMPQQLAVHPYSQPTLPLGPFANMIGYPFLPPQSYAYMPSAFQQAYASNNTYHQSLAALLPQYKNNASVGSLPQSAAVASGYGAFGNGTTIPGNFQMNQPAAPSGTALNYDDVLSSQYKDYSHLIALQQQQQQQQNENSAMWLQEANSRTMSAVPASTYYNNYQGQSQQPGGFRQGQQPSQTTYGGLGYPNYYHSQAGISLDQPQNPRDGSQGQQQPKQSQIWQNSY
ncbi:hypothetical protein ACJIZ3_008335 [Penstemon smallii]|uniref:GBF-interacting protein 1 N-terminal domain-containing protein n=1 Tax=Penstemon smallii TaxID=265156 RepID=A0ABD3T9J7_9LAMI